MHRTMRGQMKCHGFISRAEGNLLEGHVSMCIKICLQQLEIAEVGFNANQLRTRILAQEPEGRYSDIRAGIDNRWALREGGTHLILPFMKDLAQGVDITHSHMKWNHEIGNTQPDDDLGWVCCGAEGAAIGSGQSTA